MDVDHCELGCDDGYQPSGTARADCVANAGAVTASFEGLAFTCTPSTCAAPAVNSPQRILGNCTEDGTMDEDTCELGCEDGYAASGWQRGLCVADVGSVTASYAGQAVTCTPAVCVPPSLAPGVRIVSGCVANAAMGSYCELGCEGAGSTSAKSAGS